MRFLIVLAGYAMADHAMKRREKHGGPTDGNNATQLK
jgi:hypothetical protein